MIKPLPQWLIQAAERLPPSQRGVALGFAAAGWVAGQQATTPEQAPPPDQPKDPQ